MEAAPPSAVQRLGLEEEVPLARLKLAPYNPRTIDDEQLARLKRSLTSFGVVDPVIARKSDGLVIGGHQRIRAELELGHSSVPVRWLECDDDMAKAMNIALNNPQLAGSFVDSKLAALLEELRGQSFDATLSGFDQAEIDRILAEAAKASGPAPQLQTLAERFGVPPFSVLDARRGYWQERKRAWISLGIRSEQGRGKNLLRFSRQVLEAQAGARPYAGRPWEEGYQGGDAWASEGTSIFDPVLCELVYRWFSPPGARVLDPFAGGSVRGAVAAVLGRPYQGIDLSAEQVEANRGQWQEIAGRLSGAPVPMLPPPEDPHFATVRVSAAMARLLFHPCDPDFIRDTCHAKCCDAPSRPTGMLVTIHPSEQEKIEALGGRVEAGLLQPAAGCRGCPFKSAESHLCNLHESGSKPFGCIASPFTLNPNGTLIVRNRYRLLPCYKTAEGSIPAYKAHAASLRLLFGEAEAARITAHLDAGGGDLEAKMPREVHDRLLENDELKKGAL